MNNSRKDIEEQTGLYRVKERKEPFWCFGSFYFYERKSA